jgi:hypothetical protein
VFPEESFLYAVAGASLSLAGLAGLVAGLRRTSGGDVSPLDRFRLREIVEFSFAVALFALALVPLSATTGSIELAIRIFSVAVIGYGVVTVPMLARSQRVRGLSLGRRWTVVVGSVNGLIAVMAVVGIATGATVVAQWLLLLLLVRPMIAFVMVLISFERPGETAA